MQDKIALLMEETGCDRGQAELALEQCGYQVEEAVKAIVKLLKDIVVLKGRFRQPEQHCFGLILMVLNSKTRTLLRARAVVSYNPDAYMVSLDKGWFEFEKYLYGCRLWDGSLQTESQELERGMSRHFRDPGGLLEAIGSSDKDGGREWLSGVLRSVLDGPDWELSLKKEILDQGQFQSLQISSETSSRLRKKTLRPTARKEEPLALKITLDEDPAGVPAGKLRAGDVVSARVTDTRDIAQYLARLLGGATEEGMGRIGARIEAIEVDGASWWGQSGTAARKKGGKVKTDNLLVRVRFAPGVCGDASIPRDSPVKVLDQSQAKEESSWWRRFLS